MIKALQKTLNKDLLLLYGFQGLSMLSGLLFGKLVAVKFAPEVFGDYNLLLGGTAFVTSAFFTPLIYAFRHGYKSNEYGEYLHFYRSLLFWALLLIVGVGFVANGVGHFYPIPLAAMVAAMLCLQYYQDLHTCSLNLDGRHRVFAVVSFSVSLALLVALCIAVFGGGSTGVMALLLSSAAAQALGLWIGLRAKREHREFVFWSPARVFRHPLFAEYGRYVLPLAVLPLFVWAINQGDKFLIALFLNTHEVGLYGAGYGLGSKVFLALNGPIVLFLNPAIYDLAADPLKKRELYVVTVGVLWKYMLIGMVIVAAMTLAYEPIGTLLLSESYRDAFYLIPLTALAFLFLTSLSFIDQNFHALGRPALLVWCYALGAAVNIALNVWLIPRWGITGAAVAMSLSTAVQLVFQFLLYRRTLTSA